MIDDDGAVSNTLSAAASTRTFPAVTPEPATALLAKPETRETMRVAAAIVPPVKREAPRVVVLHSEPDPAVRSAQKYAKGKFKTVRARSVAPAPMLKAVQPPRDVLVASYMPHDIASDVLPNLITSLALPDKTVKGKTVSERKAKAIKRPSEALAQAQRAEADAARVHANSNDKKIDDSKPPSIVGYATRGEPVTVANAWSAEQIAEARAQCAELLTGIDIDAREGDPLKEGACGAPAPIVVSKLGAPKVEVKPAAMLTCPMAVAVNTWLTKSVQPAALQSFGVPVTRLISASSYACRNRYGSSNTPLSEHALVNALDLSGFVLADGRTVQVLGGWGPVDRDRKPVVVSDAGGSRPAAGAMRLGVPVPEARDGPAIQPDKPKFDATDDGRKKQQFLRRIHADACGTFGTVLGPEANDAHRNHFHLDMMARRRTAFCQ